MEIWKDIHWYKNYQISNLWNVKNLNFNRTWKTKEMKNCITRLWYCVVELFYKSKRWKKLYIHRLVAQEFLWLDINNPKMCVCHKDDNPSNNNVDNLFLWTQKQNIQDCVKKWRHIRASKLGRCDLNDKKVNQYDKQGKFIKTWNSAKEVMNIVLIHQWNISMCCNGLRKTAWWYKWEFVYKK